MKDLKIIFYGEQDMHNAVFGPLFILGLEKKALQDIAFRYCQHVTVGNIIGYLLVEEIGKGCDPLRIKAICQAASKLDVKEESVRATLEAILRFAYYEEGSKLDASQKRLSAIRQAANHHGVRLNIVRHIKDEIDTNLLF